MTTEASLFARVWAAPDDDAPRLVLADFLQSRDDPRGEFIALQIARANGKKGTKGREEKLWTAKNHAKWLEDLAGVFKSARFERGFPFAVTLTALKPKEAAALKRSLAVAVHPIWSTIRDIDLSAAENVYEVLTSPATRNLRVVHTLSSDDLVTLCDASEPLNLEQITANGFRQLTAEKKRALSEAKSLPRLRRLHISTSRLLGLTAADYRFFWSSPLAQRLGLFGVRAEIASLSGWLHEFVKNDVRGPVFEFNADTDAHGWRITVSPGHDGRLSSLRAEFGHNTDSKYLRNGQLDALAHAIAAAPPGLLTHASVAAFGKATLTTDRSQFDALEKALRAQTRLESLELAV